jgi:hypothetical protein
MSKSFFKLRYLGLLSVVILAYIYGAASLKYHIFPYQLLSNVKKIAANVYYNHQDTFSADSAPGETGYKWECISKKAPFAPRDGAGALVYHDRMWLIGGWNPDDKEHFPLITNNEVWSSQNGADWDLVKPNTFVDSNFNMESDWEGRHTAGYVVFKDKMWIIGGDPIQGHYQYDVWNSDDGKNWTWVNKDHPVPWGPRVLFYTVVFENKIWIIGGQTLPQFAPANEIFYSDIWNSADGINWTRIVPELPSWPARGMIGGSVVFKNRIWILGGGTYDTQTNKTRDYYNDVWSSADGVNWKLHTESAPWAPREYHDVAVFDGKMWILEGCDKRNRNDVWCSDNGTDWHKLPETPWRPRHASSIFVYDNSLWVVAGNNMESDVWRLNKVIGE